MYQRRARHARRVRPLAIIGWVAYGLAPRWLAAIMALYSIEREASAATAAQRADLASGGAR